jgi:catechol 2,3-dioxygenase-like lactoylglutathione lyase family enzyme
MRGDHLFAGVPVRDRDEAAAWWERALGRPPDLVPNDREAAWQLTDSGWLCLIADPEHAGATIHTLLVPDLDAMLAGLAERGLGAGSVRTLATGVRTAVLADPDGNRLQLGQVP